MELANRTFDLVVKIAAILAAVAAINLLGPKPHLVTTRVCHVTADDGVIAKTYRTAGRTPPKWLLEAVQTLRKSGRIPTTTTSTLDLPFSPSGLLRYPLPSGTRTRIFTGSPPLTQRSRCTPIKVTRAPGGVRMEMEFAEGTLVFVSAPRGVRLTDGRAASALRSSQRFLGRRLVRSLIDVTERGGSIYFMSGDTLRLVVPPLRADAVARSAISAATRVAADVRVQNQGRGGATDVRVEALPPFEPANDVAPFDLAPNEIRQLHFAVPPGQIAATPANPVFRSFGDKERTVNVGLLIGVGVGLGALAGAAFFNDVRKLRRRRTI